MVEPRGLEPLTSCLQSRCSSQLSYGPEKRVRMARSNTEQYDATGGADGEETGKSIRRIGRFPPADSSSQARNANFASAGRYAPEGTIDLAA